MDIVDIILNQGKYVIVPPRGVGEKDAEYLERVKAFCLGYEAGINNCKIEAVKKLCIRSRGEIHWLVDEFIKEVEETLG